MSLPAQPIVESSRPSAAEFKSMLLRETINYLQSNKTADFLIEISKIYASQEIRNRRVLAPDFYIDKEIVELLEKPENEKWRTKFTLSCLTAIKGIFYKIQYRPALNSLLHSAKLFGNSVTYRNDQDMEYISIAWHYLLDNRISLEKMEEMLQDFDVSIATVPYDYCNAAIVLSTRTVRHELLSSNLNPPLDPSTKDLKDLKELSLLILASIDVFPLLQHVYLDHRLVDQYIKDLISHTPLLTLRFVRAYPGLVSLQAYNDMLNVLLQKDDGWEFVAQSISQIHDIKSRNRNASERPVQATIPNSLESLSMDKYVEFMHNFVQRAFSASTTNSMRASMVIAEKMGEVEIINEARRQSKLQKIRQFVQKDKWLMAVQMYKDLPSKVQLYNVLLEEGKYIEAKRFADDGNLHGHVNEINPELIEKQRREEEMIYLPFPAEKVPVTMVDTLGKLFILARRLELSLDQEADSSDTVTAVSVSSGTTANNRTEQWLQIEDPSRKYISLQDMLTLIKEPETDEAASSLVQSTTRHSSKVSRPAPNEEIQATNNGSKRSWAAAAAPLSSTSSTSSQLLSNDGVPAPGGTPTPSAVISYAQKVRGVTSASSEVVASSGKSTTSVSAARDAAIGIGTSTVDSNRKIQSNGTTNSSSGELFSYTDNGPNASSTTTWPFRHIVGIDIEWYAEVYRSPSLQSASIVQLALHDHVYILDLATMSAYDKNDRNRSKIDLQLRTVAHFLRHLFNDRSILKVVFSYGDSDESVLQRVPGGFLHGISTHAQHIFDMKRDFAALADRFHVERSFLNSLSDFCSAFLGKPLHKGERMSGWDNRPLTTSQLHYAALDAHSLVAMLDVMLLRSNYDLGLNVYKDYYETGSANQLASSASSGASGGSLVQSTRQAQSSSSAFESASTSAMAVDDEEIDNQRVEPNESVDAPINIASSIASVHLSSASKDNAFVHRQPQLQQMLHMQGYPTGPSLDSGHQQQQQHLMYYPPSTQPAQFQYIPQAFYTATRYYSSNGNDMHLPVSPHCAQEQDPVHPSASQMLATTPYIMPMMYGTNSVGNAASYPQPVYPYPPPTLETPYTVDASAAGPPAATGGGASHVPWGWPYYPIGFYPSLPPPPTLQLPTHTTYTGDPSFGSSSRSNSSSRLSQSNNNNNSNTVEHHSNKTQSNDFYGSGVMAGEGGNSKRNAKGVPIAPTLIFSDAAGMNSSSSNNNFSLSTKSSLSPTSDGASAGAAAAMTGLEPLPIFTSEMKMAFPSFGPTSKRGRGGNRSRFISSNSTPLTNSAKSADSSNLSSNHDTSAQTVSSTNTSTWK